MLRVTEFASFLVLMFFVNVNWSMLPESVFISTLLADIEVSECVDCD